MTLANAMLTEQQARTEAERCLFCFDAPCIHACPAHIDIPTFIGMVRSGNTRGAAEVVKTSNLLANTCGKVCPEEVFCQSACSRGKVDTSISIRELHLYATQQEAARGYSPLAPFPVRGDASAAPKRVAVIGGGPAGLSCAFELAKLGYRCDLFDPAGAGGVPKKTIPAFRLSLGDLRSDVDFLSPHLSLKEEAVDVQGFDRLREEYNALFLGVGLGLDKRLRISGEGLKGVYPVLEFLEAAKSGELSAKIGRQVVVVGGGNVSLDAAATARRLGADEVVLIYRRGEAEMKVWRSELEEARRQGVEIRFLTSPLEIIGDDFVCGIRCRRTRLSDERDASGRRIPVEVEGSDFVMPADTIVVAVGEEIKSDFVRSLGVTRKGFLMVDERYRTALPGVFAGGDVISGEGTIVQAVAHGKAAARSIHDFLSGKTSRIQ